jgi:hypothetical protein
MRRLLGITLLAVAASGSPTQLKARTAATGST